MKKKEAKLIETVSVTPENKKRNAKGLAKGHGKSWNKTSS